MTAWSLRQACFIRSTELPPLAEVEEDYSSSMKGNCQPLLRLRWRSQLTHSWDDLLTITLTVVYLFGGNRAVK